MAADARDPVPEQLERLREELRAETAQALSECLGRLERLESELRSLRDARLQVAEPGAFLGSPTAVVPSEPSKRKVQPEAETSKPQASKQGTKEAWLPDDEKEPIPFSESTWNLLLVLGFTKAGWIDIVVGCGVLVGSLLLQGGLCYVLLTGAFLGKPLAGQIDTARRWRTFTAHDFKHLDITETSLVSRVCNEDGSLIMSTKQADLISQLNAYLGMKAHELTPEGVSPGSVLCVLCIAWWCLYVAREYRSIFSSLEGLWNVPRGPSILELGTLRSVSLPRVLLFCALRLLKAVISSLLLAAGIQWLVNAIAIRSIVLRAVAIKTLFELDAVFYAAFMPKRLQVSMRKLKPLQFRNSAWRSQLETLLLLLFFFGVTIGTWHQLVDPIAKTMERIKTEYCGGNQNFVVGVNDHHGLAVGRSSMAYDPARAEDEITGAVYDYAFKSNESHLILFHASPRSFEKTRVETMATATTSILECTNFDRWFLRGEERPIPSTYGPYFRSASLSVGMAPNSTCEDMASHCTDVDAQLLRMVCGVTCGCTEPQANPLFKVRAQGCLKRCLDEQPIWIVGEPCVDVSTDSEAWQSFWDMYPSAMEAYFGATPEQIFNLAEVAHSMKQAGCNYLAEFTHEVITEVRYCDGHPSLFSPLSLLCPRTCCTGSSIFCPSSCGV